MRLSRWASRYMRSCVQEFRNESDEALVLRAQRGETAATEELLLRYKNAVRARARKFFLQGGETDDLVQEGMIGLLTAIGAFDSSAGKRFKNFAYLCVTRRIYDALRAAGRQNSSFGDVDPDTVESGDSPEEFLLDDESAKEIQSKLMKVLSDFEFRVMTMYLDGMSYAEISDATGKEIKSIDNALARAKRKLIGYLK